MCNKFLITFACNKVLIIGYAKSEGKKCIRLILSMVKLTLTSCFKIHVYFGDLNFLPYFAGYFNVQCRYNVWKYTWKGESKMTLCENIMMNL